MTIEVNLIAILVASILGMAVGSIWYSPVLFGRPWMQATGITEEESKAMMAKGLWKYLLAGFFAHFITLYVLAHFLVIADAFDGTSAIGAAFWITVLVAAHAAHAVMWEGRNFKYYLINVGYAAVVLIGGGSVLEYWPW